MSVQGYTQSAIVAAYSKAVPVEYTYGESFQKNTQRVKVLIAFKVEYIYKYSCPYWYERIRSLMSASFFRGRQTLIKWIYLLIKLTGLTIFVISDTTSNTYGVSCGSGLLVYSTRFTITCILWKQQIRLPVETRKPSSSLSFSDGGMGDKIYKSLKANGSYFRKGWARMRQAAPLLYVFYRDGTIFYIPHIDTAYSRVHLFKLGSGTRLILNIRQAGLKFSTSMFTGQENQLWKETLRLWKVLKRQVQLKSQEPRKMVRVTVESVLSISALPRFYGSSLPDISSYGREIIWQLHMWEAMTCGIETTVAEQAEEEVGNLVPRLLKRMAINYDDK
ncbi:hypothetical protein AGABI1DRAFT_92138 [Agaricus bisporus var. burnettii JB137-S8]|uniref:Uncharacterized protein n=1 Tax=Agaricus bisporus var. burnettii (strain JB137-S8 / ATCC MYA-4627 / FGSC 10392) TaxID=597362 RepID=K5XWQ0_AGABU|nr:uncharacterized protein AGABI1DRAFT_92138 [Agaricus bisporus var. burnettii JB137-S8]EKM79655.1 hypothetical protein AGABI1DRAFT_92138 [Agaricus bisporus var. burnettii JB137-S8]